MSPTIVDPAISPEVVMFQTSGVRQRRDVNTLSDAELRALTDAFNALKTSGQYDSFVDRHYKGMSSLHRGPWFLPWHRQFLLELENALRSINASLAIPYWRFEAGLGTRLFTNTGFGPNGDPARSYRVLTGPFSTWRALIYNSSTGRLQLRSTTGLVRRIGQSGSLPSSGDVATVLGTRYAYDTSPWDTTSQQSFRNFCEGWAGLRAHNNAHTYVGGDLSAATSPNDPVFFLIHCNVDRIWAERQRRYGLTTDYAGPSGKGINDRMPYLQVAKTPAEMMNISNLGYTYVA